MIEIYPLYSASQRLRPDLVVSSEEHWHEAEALVARAARILRDAGFQMTTAVEQGDPKVMVIDSAAEWNADLTMLGSHGKRIGPIF